MSRSNESQTPLDLDLRTRIAAAIDRRYNDEAIGHTYEVCLHAADAVIRELEANCIYRYACAHHRLGT